MDNGVLSMLNIQLNVLKNLPPDAVYTTLISPVGELWLVASAKGLHALLWRHDLNDREWAALFKALPNHPAHPVLKKSLRQLEEYFAGRRKNFDLPLVPSGTAFQLRAWDQLRKIPYGQTISYHEQAKRVGCVKKARAVGTANSRNPISIIVPCHRVIAKNGGLGGFGGGLENKKILLALEQGRA